MNCTEEDYLQKITELVYDDNAIVTCTSLSKILKIQVHDAQRLLDIYVENADMPNQNDISCTYIVIGINFDSGISILVSKEKELDEKKHMLKSIVSQHAYSVQKIRDIDLTVLANIEPFTENNSHNEPLPGAVISENAIKRKLKVNPNIVEDVKEENKRETKQNEIIVNKTKEKKSSIKNFCIQGNAQTDSVKPKIETKSKQKNMMTNFFSKSTTKVENLNEQSKSELSKNLTEENNIHEEDIQTAMEESMEIELPVFKEKENFVYDEDFKKDKNEKIKPIKKSKKRQSKSKSNQPSKKRKRIVENNSSDSDIFASSESEVEVIPDIHFSEEETEEEKKVDSNLPTRTRRMKQITEEFMDEDGYMNTVTKCVMLSDDDEEEKEQKPTNNIIEKASNEKLITKNQEVSLSTSKNEISSKKSNKNSKGKNGKAPQNQTSIMSFFKRT